MRLGIFARTFPGATLEATLDAVVAHGLDTVQFNPALLGGPSLPERLAPADVRRVAEAHAARGVSMAAVSGTYNMAHPDPARRQDGARRLHALIAAAPALGTRAVTLCTGTRDPDDMWRHHPGNASAEAWSDMLEAVAAAVAAAEAAGVSVLVEPEPGNVVRDAPAARALLDRIGSPALRIVIDAANLLPPERLPEQRRALEEAFALLGPDIALAHAKDVLADGEVVAAGRGCVDYRAYLDLLRAAGFTGPLILHGLEEDEVAAAVAFLRRVAGPH
jgi:sugar phosphate isomerase/epimerase